MHIRPFFETWTEKTHHQILTLILAENGYEWMTSVVLGPLSSPLLPLGTVDPRRMWNWKVTFMQVDLKLTCLCTSVSVVCQFLNPPVCKLICLPLFVCLCESLSVFLNPCHYYSDWRVETLQFSKIIGLDIEQKFQSLRNANSAVSLI